MKRGLLLVAAVVVFACSPARKETQYHPVGGTWPGLSPSAPREKPPKKREPRRYGRRAYALNSATVLVETEAESDVEAIEEP
jgi:hypothetical protein